MLGKLDRIAVGTTGCGKHEPSDFGPPRRFQHVKRGRRSTRVRFDRFLHRTRYARNRPLMEDVINAFGRTQANVNLGKIALDPFV